MKYIGDSSIWTTYYITYVTKKNITFLPNNITFLPNNILLWRDAHLDITYVSLHEDMSDLDDTLTIKDLFVLEGRHYVLPDDIDDINIYLTFV